MIFVTGDIHGSRDIQKLSASNFPMQPQLSREDFVIICGDFGWFGRTVPKNAAG